MVVDPHYNVQPHYDSRSCPTCLRARIEELEAGLELIRHPSVICTDPKRIAEDALSGDGALCGPRLRHEVSEADKEKAAPKDGPHSRLAAKLDEQRFAASDRR